MNNKFSYLILPGVFVLILIIISIVGIGAYNSLVRLSNDVDTQWAAVENQYQRRFELIPNLEASTKAVLTQEKEVFTKLAEARANYAGVRNTGTSEEKLKATSEYESAISRLLVIVEQYPALKSNETVQNLMISIEGTENRVAVARDRYNEEVNKYNKEVEVFPTTLWAKLFGYGKRTLYQSSDGAEVAPKVNFESSSSSSAQ